MSGNDCVSRWVSRRLPPVRLVILTRVACRRSRARSKSRYCLPPSSRRQNLRISDAAGRYTRDGRLGLRACLSLRFQGLTPTPQYRPSASSRLWPARPASLCLPDPCGLGSDSHGVKVFSGKLLKFLTQTGSKTFLLFDAVLAHGLGQVRNHVDHDVVVV